MRIQLGDSPETFTYEGKEYTPQSFAASLDLNLNDYVELTSYQMYPFYEEVELTIPDNWMHAHYYNLPIDELWKSRPYCKPVYASSGTIPYFLIMSITSCACPPSLKFVFPWN